MQVFNYSEESQEQIDAKKASEGGSVPQGIGEAVGLVSERKKVT